MLDMENQISYFILAGLWILWCIIHSGMISLTVTNYVKKRSGINYRFYRFFFNVLAIVTIIPVLIYSRSLPNEKVFYWEGVWIVMQILLFLAAVFLFLAGSRNYDFLQFLGIRQIRTGASSKGLTGSGDFNTSGILNVTRHPWYLGAIFIIWARQIDLSVLVTNIIWTIYLIVGAILEEHKLLNEYGNEYRRYQKRVSMLVPLRYFKSTITNFCKS